MKIILLNYSRGTRYQALGRLLRKELGKVRSSAAKVSIDVRCDAKSPSGADKDMAKFIYVLAFLESRRLDEGDWIIWIDSDVAILDPQRDPLSFLPEDKNLAFSTDKFGLCTGVFAVRKNSWSLDLFRAAVFLGCVDRERKGELDQFDYRAEQFIFRVLLRYFPKIRSFCCLFDESLIQNRMSKFSSHAWAFHFWMEGRATNEILRKKKDLKKRGWNRRSFWDATRFEFQNEKNVEDVSRKVGLDVSDVWNLVGGVVWPIQSMTRRKLSIRESDKLIRLSNLGDEAFLSFRDGRLAREWLCEPNKKLQGRKPIEISATAFGYNRALQALTFDRGVQVSHDALKGS